MAASFDKNAVVELNYEPGRRQNPNCLSLSKKKSKMTNLTWILIFVVLILTGIIMFLATQVISESVNSEVQSCGGIINVDVNKTSKIKFPDFYGKSCTWIIKSDAKMLNLQWSYTDESELPQDELRVGELSLADEELHCRVIESQGNRVTKTVSTPAILHFTSSFHVTSLNYEVKLIPVTSGGTHKSQPQTYYVNKKPSGSVGHLNVRPDSLLGMVAVFENNEDRQLHCSDDSVALCCDSVEAYKIGSTFDGASCSKVPLSNLAKQMHNYRTVVILAPSHGDCQFNWKKT